MRGMQRMVRFGLVLLGWALSEGRALNLGLPPWAGGGSRGLSSTSSASAAPLSVSGTVALRRDSLGAGGSGDARARGVDDGAAVAGRGGGGAAASITVRRATSARDLAGSLTGHLHEV